MIKISIKVKMIIDKKIKEDMTRQGKVGHYNIKKYKIILMCIHQ